MKVREADLSDAEDIARIHVAGWHTAYRGQVPDAILDNLDTGKRIVFWQTHLDDSRFRTFVAQVHGQIIGFCDLVPSRDLDSNPQTTAEIAAIYVDPNHWRRGAGRALCLKALEKARNTGFKTVTLWTLKSNTPAQQFYRAVGFQPDGGSKSELLGDYVLHEVRFRFLL